MLPGLKTSDGALYVTNQAPAAGDTASGGVTMSPEGWVRVNGNSPQQFDQGKGFMQNGALCVDLLGSAIAGYANGLPVTATGALRCQLNQPVSPGDAYVGGLRVGPLGGLYVVDAAPTFSPASLFVGGVQGAWYDPSDFSTMFQDSAGTTPVTAAGQPVGKILDKSGRGNHATQATAASRPLLQTDGTHWWLLFDGVDDSLANAAINFTATNKMSVFSGVRKLLDQPGMIAELSTVANLTDGTFYIVPGNTAIGNGPFYCYGSHGTIFIPIDSPADYASPITNVVTGLSDISSPYVKLRVNGLQVAESVFSQGTGNYGNYPFFIGGRSNEPLRFNGRIYSLIVRGAESTPQEIEDTENWVNSKTGAY